MYLTLGKILKTQVLVFIAVLSICFGSIPLKASHVEDKIIKILKNNDSEKVRMKSVFLLGKYNSDKSFKALVDSLNDNHYLVRGAVAISLKKRGGVDAIPYLLMALEDPEALVVREAQRSLAFLARKKGATSLLVEALGNISALQRRNAILLLQRSTEEAALEGMLLGLVDKDSKVRAVAGDVLENLNPTILEKFLLKNLEHSNEKIQREVVIRVGRSKLASAVYPLLSLYLTTLNSDLKKTVEHSLGLILKEGDFEPFVLEFEQTEDLDKSGKALLAMAFINLQKAVPYVDKALDNENKKIWLKAVSLVSKYKIHFTLPKLKEMIKNQKYYRYQKIIKSTINRLER